MQIHFRDATADDLPALVQLLANDELGAHRENPNLPLDARYSEAFAKIDQDNNNAVIVVDHDGEAIGMLQLTFIPYLTHRGSWRCLIEGVRIDDRYRGQGLGEKLFQHAIERALARGCGMVQLTSDKQRPDALRFYKRLGFVASHEGFKLAL